MFPVCSCVCIRATCYLYLLTQSCNDSNFKSLRRRFIQRGHTMALLWNGPRFRTSTISFTRRIAKIRNDDQWGLLYRLLNQSLIRPIKRIVRTSETFSLPSFTSGAGSPTSAWCQRANSRLQEHRHAFWIHFMLSPVGFNLLRQPLRLQGASKVCYDGSIDLGFHH
jgi:hypothetical protein